MTGAVSRGQAAEAHLSVSGARVPVPFWRRPTHFPVNILERYATTSRRWSVGDLAYNAPICLPGLFLRGAASCLGFQYEPEVPVSIVAWPPAS